jgi:hypothetical protein
MFKEKTISIFLIACALFYLAGCKPQPAPVSKGGYYHSGIYFGKNFSENFKNGIVDGCTTSKGEYKKSHKLFNNDNDYNDGWFLGRNRCKHLLVLDVDKE